MKYPTKMFCTALLGATLAVTVTDRPAHAARMSSPGISSPAASDVSDLRPPDPHKELRHLSKNLRLKKDQRVGVSSILQERTREIRLLIDIEPLSPQDRNALAAKVMDDSNAQIETLLKSKQKRKFDNELAKDGETH